jgi:arginase
MLEAARARHPELPLSDANVVRVRSVPFSNDIASTLAIDAMLASAVATALDAGRMPLVLAADCISCLGSLAGMRLGCRPSTPASATSPGAPEVRLGAVWLDAHADFNTTATTVTGYLDGMALAAATGREFAALSGSLPGFRRIAPGDVLHMGGRSFDPGEAEALEAAGVRTFPASALRSGAPPARLREHFVALAGRVDAVYLHIDLDVLDPAEGIANAYSAPGGVTAAELEAVVRACLADLPVRSMAITAYDPEFDQPGWVAAIAAELIAAAG